MNHIGIIFRKEIRDMFRDKRVRSAAFIMPSVIIFMMMYFLGFVQDTVKPVTTKVYVVGNHLDSVLGPSSGKLTVIKIGSVEEGQQLIRDGKASVVLDSPSTSDASKPEHTIEVDAYFNPKQERSQVDLEQVQGLLALKGQEMLVTALTAHHLQSELAEPIKLEQKEVQVGAKSSPSEFVLQLLPYLIVIWAFYGGMSTATELVAGEKDKSTLETLLISPASRTQIAMGKFFALSFICLVSSLSCFIGLILAQQTHVSDEMLKKGLGITPLGFAVIVAVLIPTVALFSSILLAISTYAKNPREAQTYLTGVSLVVLMPAMFSQFIGFTDFASASWLYAVPVLNTATILRQALQGQMNTGGILTCVGISVALASIAIYLAVKLFNRENVLVRV